jgi:myosin heavy subunit
MNEVVRTPGVIATEINSIKGQTRAMVLHASAEIGKRLIEAKEMLTHGEWGGWLEENIDYSQSTANNLMQLYREYGSDTSKIPTLGNISYTKALALLSVPEEEREQFIADNDVENVSARELQKIIKEKQQLEKQIEKAEKAAEKEKDKLSKNIKKLEKQLQEASSMKADPETIDNLNRDLNESRLKIKQLEADLKAKPIEVATATVEVVPEEVEKELNELREKVNLQQGDENVVAFRLRFESLVSEFKNLLGALDTLSESEDRGKYKEAVKGLIAKMNERLG